MVSLDGSAVSELPSRLHLGFQLLSDPACGRMARAVNGLKGRNLVVAAVDFVDTPRSEGATGRQLRQVRRLSVNGVELGPARLVKAGNRAEQPKGVRMPRPGVDLASCSLLDDLSSIHDV